MCLKYFKEKKKKAIKKSKDGLHQTVINESRELINENVKKLDSIIDLYSDKIDENMLSKLNNLCDTIKYLNPSNRVLADEYDKKIGNKIDDLRIVLSKKEVNEKALDEAIFNVKSIIAKRNADC